MHFDHVWKDCGFIMHWHENIELLYFVEGEADVVTDNVSARVKPGQLAVVNSNALHKVQSDGDVYYYCIIINTSFLENFGISTYATTFERLVESESVTRIFEHIINEFNTRDTLYQTNIKADILLLMTELIRNHISSDKPSFSADDGSRLDIAKKVLRYVHQNFREPLTLDTISSATGFSKFYLSHLFKDVVGCSPIHYLNRLRCHKARDLLVFENYTVGEAAAVCGFENVSYFSQTYKKHMQTLPGQEKKGITAQ
jgi:AraC-like DNA-binding protein